MDRTVAGTAVRGIGVGPETRCHHYHGPRDVVAIAFPCCGTYYPCFECHEATADHPPEQWPTDRFEDAGVLCGACGTELSVAAYLDCGSQCPACDAAFNPGCLDHRHLYFEGGSQTEP